MFSKYYERGLAVIPILPNSKAPVGEALEYPKWASIRQNETLIQRWDEKYKAEDGYGVGIVLGAVSNLDAVDIDTLMPEIIAECPVSPVVRRGNPRRYGALLFRHNKFLDFTYKPLGIHIDGHKHGVDILSSGRYLIVPPSINKDSETPYVWLTPDTLENFSADDLPILLPEHVARIETIFDLLRNNTPTSRISNIYAGRNDYLKSIVWAKRMAEESEEDIIEAVYQSDLCNHNPRLFTDETEGFKANNEFEARFNVWKFVNRITRSFIERRAGPVPSIKLPEISLSGEIKKQNKWIHKSYPEARGFMKDFVDYCELVSSSKQSALGLGGAIGLMSVLCSNRFNTQVKGLTTCPNTYTINLAPSSFGKETAQKIIHDLLIEVAPMLLGGASYRSGSSIVMGLPKQQERLDLIDECSSLLRAMGGKEDYKSEIVEVLSSLYSKANSKFLGFSSVASGEKYGACWNPCVSMLGSTTPAGFRSSVNKDMAAKGLLPRFFLFMQSDLGEYKGRQSRRGVEELYSKLKNFMGHFIEHEKTVHIDFKPNVNLLAKTKGPNNEDMGEGVRYNPTVIPFNESAHDFWLNYDEECHNKKGVDPDGFESAFIGRFSEKTAKLALLDTLSLGRSTIELDSVKWAKEVVEVEWHNSMPLYELASAETKYEANVMLVLKYIQSRGRVKASACKKAFQTMPLREFKEIIDRLKEQGQIQELVDSSDKSSIGRPPTFYTNV